MKYDSSTGKMYEELGCTNNNGAAGTGGGGGGGGGGSGGTPMDTLTPSTSSTTSSSSGMTQSQQMHTDYYQVSISSVSSTVDILHCFRVQFTLLI